MRGIGKLSRLRMLVAAAPTTRKQVSATRVMALVNNVSIPAYSIQNWMPIKALACRRRAVTGKSAKIAPKRPRSGRGRQLIGFLDIGHDLMGLKQRAARHRSQADRPVALAGAGHADDVEFDAAAQRMALQGVVNAGPELVEGRRGFSKKPIGIHIASPPLLRCRAVAADRAVRLLLGLAWLTAG